MRRLPTLKKGKGIYSVKDGLRKERQAANFPADFTELQFKSKITEPYFKSTFGFLKR
jgi:hypothetical protein